MNADGSNVTQLTNHPANDLIPAWSPDGRKIAFTSTRDGNANVYVMNADGSNVTQLTDHPSGSWWPAWSPDGQQIAFASGRDGNPFINLDENLDDIYVMNADGSGVTRITNTPAVDESYPAWSPGTRIALVPITQYIGSDFYDFTIHVMDADGSNLTRLGETGLAPAWSPDDRKIAFLDFRFRDGESSGDIYTMNADGSGLARITTHPSDDTDPTWAPNGLWIAFSSERDGGEDKGDIYIKQLDGGRVIRLTDDDSDETNPAWSPR